jgi:hypothetical protein
MLRRFGQELRLGVARSGVALIKSSRWGRGPATVLAEVVLDTGAADSAASLAQAVNEVLELGAHDGGSLTIVLADELVRLWQVTPPLHATRLADLQAAAALRFQGLFGEPTADWQISAGWDAVHPFLAAALPRALYGALHLGAANYAMKVVEIVPQFIAVQNRWCRALRPGAWFGVVHDDVLTLGAVEGDAITAVRACAVPGGADGPWLAEHLKREALRMSLPAPQHAQLWGSVPSEWLESRAIACTQLGAPEQSGWSAQARLAASGSAA